MKKNLVLSALLVALPLTMMAQDDDMYFVPKKQKKVETYYAGSSRNIDEYNRRVKTKSQVTNVDENSDIIDFDGKLGLYPDSVAFDSLYDVKVKSRVQSFTYDEDDDYQYSRMLDRWYGVYDPWFYGYGYWGAYRYWHSPFYWNDPWFYSCYYDPFYWNYGYYSPYGWWGGYYGFHHYHDYWWYNPHYYGYYNGYYGGGHHNDTHYNNNSYSGSGVRGGGASLSASGIRNRGNSYNNIANQQGQGVGSTTVTGRVTNVGSGRRTSSSGTRSNSYNSSNSSTRNNSSSNYTPTPTRSSSSYGGGSFSGGGSRGGSVGGGGGSRGGSSGGGGGAARGGRR